MQQHRALLSSSCQKSYYQYSHRTISDCCGVVVAVATRQRLHGWHHHTHRAFAFITLHTVVTTVVVIDHLLLLLLLMMLLLMLMLLLLLLHMMLMSQPLLLLLSLDLNS